MFIQRINTLLMRLGVEPHRQVATGQMIDPLIVLKRAINPVRQLLLVLNAQQHTVVAPQHFQFRDAQ